MKYFKFIILIIVLNNCNFSNTKYYQKFGNHIYSTQYFTIKFDNRFKQITPLYYGINYIEKSKYFSVYSSIIDNKINRYEGNTAIINFYLIHFNHLLTRKEIENNIDYIFHKNISEANGMNNKRFKNKYIAGSNFVDNKHVICKILFTSIEDYNAKNKPNNQNYLVQNDIYKICYLNKYNLLIMLAISFRMTPQFKENLWIDNFIDNFNAFSSNIITKDGENLNNIITINKNEFKGLSKL